MIGEVEGATLSSFAVSILVLLFNGDGRKGAPVILRNKYLFLATA